jgi:hypothetical protein
MKKVLRVDVIEPANGESIQIVGFTGGSDNDYNDIEKAKVAFITPATIDYTTEIPFTRALTIITGKTLESNDVFTIAANPVEGGGAQIWLDGDGTHSPGFTAFDYQSGTYAATSGTRNLITIEYLGAKSYISILNMIAI